MVVVNDGWGKNLAVPLRETLAYFGSHNKMTSRAVLICRFNSHHFHERNLVLDQPVKIGRSVARAKPANNNAIFDCKVLSRNHALLWYDSGKFYLQDTKSSNGTFVNNHRLSKGGEESAPREVCSGDIVQFGVDVMENAGKITHGCIIATLRLYLPDGKEAKASPSTVNSQETVGLEDLYALNSYLQEALQRENQLEKKLHTLQQLLDDLRKSCDQGWKALIDEDRLLSRVEILECQLKTYAKNTVEDDLREEVRKLLEDKLNYQGAAKEELQKVLEEKLEAVQKVEVLETTKASSEQHLQGLRQLLVRSQQDLSDLAQKYGQQCVKLVKTEDLHRNALQVLEEERKESESQLAEQVKAEKALQDKLERLQADGDVTQQQLRAVLEHLSGLETGVAMDLILQRIRNTLKVEINECVDTDLIDEEDQVLKKDPDNAETNTQAIDGLKASIAIRNEMLESMRDKVSEFERKTEKMKSKLRNRLAVVEWLKDYSRDPFTVAQKQNRQSEETEELKKLEWEAQENEKLLSNGDDCLSEKESDMTKQDDDKCWKNNPDGNAFTEIQVALLQEQKVVLDERNELCKRLALKVEELEEELVVLRERFSQCNMDRTRMSESLRDLKAGSGQVAVTRLLIPGLVVMFAIIVFFWLNF